MYWTNEQYAALAEDIIRNGDGNKELTQDIVIRACARVDPSLYHIGETISRTRMRTLRQAIDLQRIAAHEAQQKASSLQEAVMEGSRHRRNDLADLMFKSLLKEQTEDIMVRIGGMFQAMSGEINSLRAEVATLKAEVASLTGSLGSEPAAPVDTPQVATTANHYVQKTEEVKIPGRKRIHVFHLESRSFRELEDNLRKQGLLKNVDLTYTPTTGGIPNCSPDKYDAVYYSNLFVHGGLANRLKKVFTKVVQVEGGNSKLQEAISKDLTSWKEIQVKDMIG